MNCTNAAQVIGDALAAMARQYMRPVFDEWVLLTVSDRTVRILAYEGPRPDNYRDEFAEDMRVVAAGLLGTHHNPGDFEFSHEGDGKMYDAFVVAGERVFLALNNTAKSMPQITADPLWRDTQGCFLRLCDSFRCSPVTA